MSFNPLGRQTDYVSVYSPQLLFPIARIDSRRSLGIGADLPFYGQDVWTGYELSWLNAKGKPQVAVAEFKIPCTSEFIVESKSFKLYLNSFNQTQFDSAEAVQAILVKDLSAAAGASVSVDLWLASGQGITPLADIGEFEGDCLDDLDVSIDCYHPQPELLQLVGDELVERRCYSNLLKTNCPVTGQPDWASVFISYRGRAIAPESLLRYLISFREHQDFHEHCVERIYCDIRARCAPETLTVYARYTRRGGLDINPFRTSAVEQQPGVIRLIRQ